MREWRLWAGAAAFLLLFGTMLALVEAPWQPLLRFDLAVDQHLHNAALRQAAWTGSMRTISAVLEPTVLRVLLAVVVVWLWWRGARIAAVWATACGVVQAALEVGVKEAVARPRPALPHPVAVATDWAFPSGHAMTAATILPLLLAIAWPRLRRSSARVLAATVAGGSVLLVSWTRIGLGVHWPSDVLAGWFLAGFTLCAVTAAVDSRRPGLRDAELRRLRPRASQRVQRSTADPL
ncbi:phosphatase PAP2 family protein [Streptacidiphilus sp. MAP5-3]|uniref:phosphatase PAP2 family protein n=1 Tax=unclassified Streptacidiphilus TaxID=2643834 RepID=UPI003518C877